MPFASIYLPFMVVFLRSFGGNHDLGKPLPCYRSRGRIWKLSNQLPIGILRFRWLPGFFQCTPHLEKGYRAEVRIIEIDPDLQEFRDGLLVFTLVEVAFPQLELAPGCGFVLPTEVEHFLVRSDGLAPLLLVFQ